MLCFCRDAPVLTVALHYLGAFYPRGSWRVMCGQRTVNAQNSYMMIFFGLNNVLFWCASFDMILWSFLEPLEALVPCGHLQKTQREGYKQEM